MEIVETRSASPDVLVVHPLTPEPIDKPPSPIVLGVLLIVVGAIGFSPWLVAKMARETPPQQASVAKDWLDSKWHHSHLMQTQENYMTQSRLAYKLQNERMFEKSAHTYTVLLNESSKNREFNYVSRGKCYLMLKRYDLALSDFTNAIALDQQDSDAYFSRAKAYRKLGKTAEADADMVMGMKYNH